MREADKREDLKFKKHKETRIICSRVLSADFSIFSLGSFISRDKSLQKQKKSTSYLCHKQLQHLYTKITTTKNPDTFTFSIIIYKIEVYSKLTHNKLYIVTRYKPYQLLK